MRKRKMIRKRKRNKYNEEEENDQEEFVVFCGSIWATSPRHMPLDLGVLVADRDSIKLDIPFVQMGR